MDSFELNKIAGAVLFALLVSFGLSIFSEILFETETPESPGYVIAVAEPAEGEGGAAAPAERPNIAVLLASADPAAGEASARKCATCHSFGEGEAHKIGPNLYETVGQPIAAGEGYSYSDAMLAFAEEAQTWSYDNLDHFLFDPQGTVPGTKMAFAGLKVDAERANVIAYLRSLSASPVPLPEPPAEGEAAPAEGEAAAEGGEAPAGDASAEGAEAPAGEAAAEGETPAAGEQAPAVESAGQSGGDPQTQPPANTLGPIDSAPADQQGAVPAVPPAQQPEPTPPASPADEPGSLPVQEPGQTPGEEPAATEQPAEEPAAPAEQQGAAPQQQPAAPAEQSTAPAAGASAFATLVAESDPAQGESLARRCLACHTIDESMANRIGPHLWGVVNRPVASVEDFEYTEEMVAFSEGGTRVWDFDTLGTFLADPQGVVPGTQMVFPGIADEAQRAQLIAYLNTLGANPPPGGAQ